MFKEKFIELCNSRGVSPSKVCREIGITPATFSGWTSSTIPRDTTLQKAAAYFGVSVDYLIGKENNSTESEYKDITAQEKALLAMFRSTSEEGRLKIIQSVMNICDEIEKKTRAKTQKNVD